MTKKKKIILFSGILLLIIIPCLMFIFFEKIIDTGLLIRSYQSKSKFSENNFDHFFSKNGKKVFEEKSEFIGNTKDDVYGCQFKISFATFSESLAKAGLVTSDKQNKNIFNNVKKYASSSGLALLSHYKEIIYNESGIFVKDISDTFIRGPVYIYANTYTDGILLITICFIRI